MKYILNGYDLEEKFGLIIKNGVDPLLAMPERKESVTNDFQDQNGIEKDLAAPKFKARTFVFDCALEANDANDLQVKYFGLFNLLSQQGVYTLYNDFLNLTVTIFYTKFTSNNSGLYKTSNNKIATDFKLEFGETDPYGNIPIVYLVDDVDRYLIP